MDFKIGDEVEFELNFSKKFPRWNCNSDGGGSGLWAKGLVKAIDFDNITIYSAEIMAYWNWPIRHFEKNYPGYLRKVKAEEPKCECGSEAVSGPICGHSFWCPKS